MHVPAEGTGPASNQTLPSPSRSSVYLRKLLDDEQPLRLRLLAGPSEKALSFVLKENDSGEVNVSAQPPPFLVATGQA